MITIQRNLHWQQLGWQFDEIMQLRRQLKNMDPFLNAGTYELQQEIGGDIYDTEVSEATLQQMPYLVIDDDEFNGDLEFLRQFTELRDLFILGICASGKITDLEPLTALSKLRYLNLEYHEIQDLSPLAQLSELREVYLCDNPLRSIKPLIGLQKIEKVAVSEASEEEVFELLRSAPNCRVDYISPEHEEGLSAFWLDDWAYQTSYFKDYHELKIEAVPLLHKEYPFEILSRAAYLKEHTEARALSFLRADEKISESIYKTSKITFYSMFKFARK